MMGCTHSLTDDEMLALVKKARAIAQPVGPQHALWDVIFDAEAILRGKPSLASRKSVERMLVDGLGGMED